MISYHLGAGSLCAIKNGKSYDISMGFTPLSGAQMATRSGDVDVSLVSYIMKKLDIKSIDKMIYFLNKESGFKGVSGVSADMREVEQAAAAGNQRTKLAIELYITSIIRYIGQYIAELQGIDAITFTAGIGENGIKVR
ncbi:acetate kinase [Ligilactobacillus araffinosus DSM 20653]|uniref:Acetate kinase n=1 Tax=Ligilactobacillus araffinosus DSM 20653 TaxID=1423820 RepID=A0A0R1ZFV5_9LACO|nr:acetate kinase [Ligilactobacillus araffinosus DSM 20653]